MIEEGNSYPAYPTEIVKDHGGVLVRKNPRLVNEVLARKERQRRMQLNMRDTASLEPTSIAA